jgi:hypothetical protein
MMPGSSRPPLPIFLQPPGSISVSGMRVILDQRGWPRAALVEGPVADDGDRLGLFIAAEFEEPQHIPRAKAGVEWLHLGTARADLERAGNLDLSAAPSFGNDPPDFRLGGLQGLAVELAQFTQSTRRQALGLLNAVKRAILEAPAERFQHLRDRLVMVGFEDPRGLPPRSSDQEAINAVLQRLEILPPGPGPQSVPEALNSDGFAVLLVNSTLGRGLAACFPLPALPQSTLAGQRGFELAASLTVVVRARDTEAELARLTAEHDTPTNHVLLISAGAPGRSDGFALVGDEIAVEPWILKTVAMPKPRHLKRILLHRWSHGDVYELFPRYKELAPSRINGGGPLVVPVSKAPSWLSSSDCPCGTGAPFANCHGQTGQTVSDQARACGGPGSAERLALSCGRSALARASMLGTTAALAKHRAARHGLASRMPVSFNVRVRRRLLGASLSLRLSALLPTVVRSHCSPPARQSIG